MSNLSGRGIHVQQYCWVVCGLKNGGGVFSSGRGIAKIFFLGGALKKPRALPKGEEEGEKKPQTACQLLFWALLYSYIFGERALPYMVPSGQCPFRGLGRTDRTTDIGDGVYHYTRNKQRAHLCSPSWCLAERKRGGESSLRKLTFPLPLLSGCL